MLWTFAKTLESRRPDREDVVRSGVLKGMVCSSAHGARMVEQLSELNAGFRAECGEQDTISGVDSMVDHIGRAPMNTMCLCEGIVCDHEILVSNFEWADIEFEVAPAIRETFPDM